MNYLGRSIIFGFLFFLVLGIFAYAQIKAGNFSPGQLEAHYLKHGEQFGNITQEQYLQGAQALLDAEPEGDILEKIRQNGDVEHFRVSTGEFAVMTKRGRIRTYFKTDYAYWLRQ
jgi:pyocin large subunit-like protein